MKKKILKSFTNKNKIVKQQIKSFHNSIRFVIVVGQIFALFPLQGITSDDINQIRFSWKSFRTFYSIFMCITLIYLSLLTIYSSSEDGINILEIAPITFHVSALTTYILFIKLAAKWSDLRNKWSNLEHNMRSYGWPKGLDYRFKTVFYVTFITAFVETTLIKVSKITLSYICKKENQGIFEFYVVSTLYPEIFKHMRYSTILGIIFQFVNIAATFAWTYIDVFIVLLSIAVALRFKQITNRLKLFSFRRINNVDDWRNIREDYNRLSVFTKTLNEAISSMILLSFSTNFSFIILQLFQNLREMRDGVERVYFFFSFVLLIIRTLAVSIYAAWINDESKEPINILFSLPSEIYNSEISRFMEQLLFDNVCLSGKDFFFVTRGIILSMAGAVVTYELIVIQTCGEILKNNKVEYRNESSIC